MTVFFSVLSAMLTTAPPERFFHVSRLSDLSVDDIDDLAFFSSKHSKVAGVTGISLLHAADLVSADSLSNGLETNCMAAGGSNQQEGILSVLLSVTLSLRDYIDSLPEDVANNLPAMPGIDRDWADDVINEARNIIK